MGKVKLTCYYDLLEGVWQMLLWSTEITEVTNISQKGSVHIVHNVNHISNPIFHYGLKSCYMTKWNRHSEPFNGRFYEQY